MKEATKRKIIKGLWLVLGVGAGIVILLILSVILFADIPSFEELENPNEGLATQIISSDGKVLCTIHMENRQYVTYDELSPHLIHAAIATEDARFYNHSGIDFLSLGRVLFKTVLLSDSSQGGGSTITQQLAKTLYPRGEENIIWLKLKEWVTAVKIERNYSKEEILTMYMNSIFFGSNAHGINAAAQTFFAKHPKDLTVEESAMLIGAVNKPTRYNPKLNPDKALGRRNFVIGQMAKNRFITRAERDSIQQVPINLTYEVQDHLAGHGLYFRDMINATMSANEPKRKSYLQYQDYVADSLRWKNDALYGWLNKNLKSDGTKYNLYTDGLKIYTTIDSRMQKYAEEAIAEHIGKTLQKQFWANIRYNSNKPFANDVPIDQRDFVMNQGRRNSERYRMMKQGGASESEIKKSFRIPVKMRVFAWNDQGYIDTTLTPDDSILYYKAHMRAAFMAMEPETGFVKAYVGGPNYQYFKYDQISQGRRQVGSVIKPFLYTVAMQEGMSPCHKVTNTSEYWTNHEGETWSPKTTDKEEDVGRIVTLQWGLARSSNNISAYLMKHFGPQPMVDMMRKMGVTGFIDPVPSLCVGAADISIAEMIAAYNTYPSRGVYVKPLYVTSIEDNHGNLLTNFYTTKNEAISEKTAYLMANLMQGVVNRGTGIRLRAVYAFKGEIGGKTGTTNGNADGWFIGYVPRLTAGAWVGAENQQIRFSTTALGGGSNSALPIWALFMKKVYADASLGIPEDDIFEAPSGERIYINCDEENAEGVEPRFEDISENLFN